MDSSSFQSLCALLREKQDKPGEIRRACAAVEDCLITNKCVLVWGVLSVVAQHGKGLCWMLAWL